MTRANDPSELLPELPLLRHARHRASALMSLLQVHWFIRLRWAFVGVALAVLAVERFVTPEAVRPGTLALPVLLLAVVNLVWMGLADVLLRQFRRPDADEPRTIRNALLFANAQVGVDLLLLTMILRYTGGVENPMALFYLFHMGIGALLLKSWHAVMQGMWAMMLYAALAVGELGGWIVPHWDFLPQFPSPGLYARPEFVVAMLAVMACGVFATLYFTLHITGRLDEREQQLREAYEALRRSKTAIYDLQLRRSRFMQTAAHQLKAPLASIQTLVGLLSDRVVSPDSVRTTYERITMRCREGMQQVGELLTLARVRQADPRRHRRNIADVCQVVLDVNGRLAPQAESRGITLECSVPKSDTLYARVDPADLRDCLTNLVENAIKYTNAPGRVSLSVRRWAEGARELEGRAGTDARDGPAGHAAPAIAPDSVCVTVTDTGIGIEPDALAGAEELDGRGSIFDAFRRGNSALAAGIPGTGLGLAIVREVVEQAGGRIFVRSSSGVGSSFTVVFPSRAMEPEEPAIRDTRSSVVVLAAPPDRRPPEGATERVGLHPSLSADKKQSPRALAYNDSAT